MNGPERIEAARQRLIESGARDHMDPQALTFYWHTRSGPQDEARGTFSGGVRAAVLRRMSARLAHQLAYVDHVRAGEFRVTYVRDEQTGRVSVKVHFSDNGDSGKEEAA